VVANAYIIDRQLIPQERVDSFDRGLLHFARPDVRLIGNYYIQKPPRAQALERVAYAGQYVELAKRRGRVRFAPAHDRAIDYAIAVKKDRAALHHFVAIC
jgi:hypothetical protein